MQKNYADKQVMMINRQTRGQKDQADRPSLQDDTMSWDGELSAAAEAILHQHAIQGDLTPLQQAICRWTAAARTHTHKPLDHRVLHRLLMAVHDLWDTETLSKEEVGPGWALGLRWAPPEGNEIS